MDAVIDETVDEADDTVDTLAWGDPRWAEHGITWRRLDYWTRIGLLEVIGDTTPGTGYPRRWPASELDVAARIVRLTAAGLDVHVSARVARAITQPVELAPGILVEVA